jgi:phosphatidylglycerophosphate synthase
LDGPIARKKGQESSTGGLLDHSCDAFLVAVLLFVLTKTHEIPLLLPVLVILSFLQYVFDSKALTGQRLRTSFLGRSNGICYFVLASLCIFTEALEINLPDYFIVNFAWILITSTLLSMSERLWTLVTK